MSLGESVFLNIRGLYIPAPVPESGFSVVVIAFVIAVASIFYISRWGKRRKELTGQESPVFLMSIGVLIGLPLVAYLISGMPMHLDYPALKGFNFQGGIGIIPELFSYNFV